MGIHTAIHHVTAYRYDRRVGLSPQIVRLRPAPHSRTRVLSYSLTVEPKPHFINWQQDPHGNWLARVVFPEKIEEFKVTVDLVADMAVYNPFDFFVEPAAEKFPFDYEPLLKEDLKPYMRAAPAGPLLRAWLDQMPASAPSTVNFVVQLNRELQEKLKYLIRLEPGIQTPEETLAKASGSCRDSSWLLVQLLRNLGLAARFVSGYLIQLKPDLKSLDGPSGTDHDFTDLHAWCEVYVPGAGWIGLDPTSGLMAGEGHIPLCATPEPQSAAPISGAVEKCEVEFGHEMHVSRLRESARVTLPYSDEQWAAIDALGDAVDSKLKAADVRLTMGGEPTFVSLDDMQGAEWNTAAVGPAKQALAYVLAQKLRARFAPQGVLTYGQGKWYPGESLPRWVYALWWRRDAQPVWKLPPAQADLKKPPAVEATRTFIEGLATRLEVDPRNVLEAYEDTLHYLIKERKLPVNVDPSDPRLKDPEERQRIVGVFERGLGTPRGYVLPVQRWQSQARWLSERWPFRSGKLFLLPGESPIGLRLPLDSLPWVPPQDYPQVIPQDPSARAPTLPAVDAGRQPFLLGQPVPSAQDKRGQRLADGRQPAEGRAGAGGYVRTALSVESREGYVNVFLPPVERTEDFLDLVAAVEDVAAQTGLPVRIEGYAPPSDGRLNNIKITPDPGVIEVNIHPAHSWPELRDNTLALYEDARQARLTTEKFLIDGRAVGTGGGNHVVVGAATPNDSPFLRRPDLLGSFVRYWQNHPCLSYLFSGLFIGPTSQHPRADEGRDTALYELDLALAQLPAQGDQAPAWRVDRILRNLLVDLTGNTHRAEFCIDKLFSPDSPTGRLGLLELRGFEMPPHARMSLTQQLLVRALIAWFWQQPYTQPTVRWGTSLHDRWMLPWDNWLDLGAVVADLQGAGFPLQQAWFAPHWEFRFPAHGTVDFEGVSLELRHALEPWPVLGEEPAGGGTTRFVDSSIERLQVKLTGLTPSRHGVNCNGRRVPLRPTGTRGEYVGAVRYRAWQPAACLHPTIGVHAPLVFDLYDAWNRRAVAGCTYHVAHPAGRNYDTFPVNSYEAEARRLARFEPAGHTPGNYDPPAEMPNPEFPGTLDLRRPNAS
ncbi:MAG TPA: transglutaminase family protein [Solimonas sp.]|nr:transglutaminase family protein [Solimonas sp.]